MTGRIINNLFHRNNRLAATTPTKHTGGFTLIELLIVVAILTVLSAIATPNFLEAQTRAKVSRTHNDLRTLSTALETYRVDYNGYPVVGNPDFPDRFDVYISLTKRLKPLTTPVSYITTLPGDPFYSKDVEGIASEIDHYVYAPGNLYFGASSLFASNQYRNTIYSVSGRGPDRKIYFGGYCMAHPVAHAHKANIIGLYDPTNGTTSKGDIFRNGTGTLGQGE